MSDAVSAEAGIAVIDIGKTNVKLSAVTGDGRVITTLSTANPVLPGPPWRHHDLGFLTGWVMEGLAALCHDHPISDVIATGHGASGVMVGDDPGAGDGTALPMQDYEDTPPGDIVADYPALAGSYAGRGSAIMPGATHTARQMLWAARAEPAGFARVRWALGVPQYWAWWLSGVAVAEASTLAAQSHLWSGGEWRPIVADQGWGRMMPPVVRAGDVVGNLRPALAARYGLPAGLRIRAGGHDSSVAFHRYQATGLRGMAVVSTGTWIVALTDTMDPARLDEARGMTRNADTSGAAIYGALCMGGRDYAAILGDDTAPGAVEPAALARIVARGVMALPSFGPDDGQFPGSAGRGRMIGPPPEDAGERHALGVLTTALLTLACGDAVAPDLPWILDGSFLSDPAFAAIVAALRPGREVRVNRDSYGIAAGAALLCRDGGIAPALTLLPAAPITGIAGLQEYAARWRATAGGKT